MFKIGESDSGRKLKVTLKEYVEYAMFGRDDSPLYMFESALEDHPEAKEMLKEYEPVKFCQQDLSLSNQHCWSSQVQSQGIL